MRERVRLASGLVRVGFLVHELSILDETVSKGAAARIVAATAAAAMAGRPVFVALMARVSAAGAGAAFLVLQSVALVFVAGGAARWHRCCRAASSDWAWVSCW